MTRADQAPRRDVVVVASGGLDSTTLAYWLDAEGWNLTLLGVDYGQRHCTELSFLRRTAAVLKAPYVQLNISDFGKHLAGTALTDQRVDVPAGHYTDPSMHVTLVPHRNALLLDLAVGVAVSTKADAVAFGAHSGDHPVYPDCRPEFVKAYTQMVAVSNEGFLADGFEVLAPFLTWTKADIVRLGAEVGVPFSDTWSCYRGGAKHCGKCGTCTERKEAFAVASVGDPTEYMDSDLD